MNQPLLVWDTLKMSLRENYRELAESDGPVFILLKVLWGGAANFMYQSYVGEKDTVWIYMKIQVEAVDMSCWCPMGKLCYEPKIKDRLFVQVLFLQSMPWCFCYLECSQHSIPRTPNLRYRYSSVPWIQIILDLPLSVFASNRPVDATYSSCLSLVFKNHRHNSACERHTVGTLDYMRRMLDSKVTEDSCWSLP